MGAVLICAERTRLDWSRRAPTLTLRPFKLDAMLHRDPRKINQVVTLMRNLPHVIFGSPRSGVRLWNPLGCHIGAGAWRRSNQGRDSETPQRYRSQEGEDQRTGGARKASVAWAKFIVDGDLAFEIDAREIPSTCSTGRIPFGRSAPYQPPPQPFFSI
jgi:hypothetical protein